MTNYRNETESRYFGSDLNKFINQYCSKEMTVNNIDLIMYKRSKRSMRIIESKHLFENMPPSQLEVLRILAKFIKPALEALKILEFNIYIVEGNPPYDEARITDVHNDNVYVLDNEELRRWLEFNYDLKYEV